MSANGVIPEPEERHPQLQPWNGTYVVAGDGNQIAIGAQGREVWIGPSLYTEPIWRLDQEQVEEFAHKLVRFVWEAGRQDGAR